MLIVSEGITPRSERGAFNEIYELVIPMEERIRAVPAGLGWGM